MTRRKKRPTRKKKKKKVTFFRFQLSWPGIAGVAVVCFCLFLWMFLIGIWAGQTILLPPGNKKVTVVEDESKIRVEKKRQEVRRAQKISTAPQIKQDRVKATVQKKTNESKEKKQPERTTAPVRKIKQEKREKKQYYTLQIGAYRDVSLARKEAAYWRNKKAKVYLMPALKGKDALVRVCIGKFERQADAGAYVKKLVMPDKTKPYITHFPASMFR